MIDEMMKKYDNEECSEDNLDVQNAKNEKNEFVDDYTLDDADIEDVSRDICLPSIKDSKLWRVSVIPGKERELVFKITNKLIEYLNCGNPLNVLEVFECSLS